jgi:hypothetical protein
MRPGYLVALGIGLAGVLISPVAPLLLDRTGEIQQPASSGYSRFVAPYVRALDGLTEHPGRFVVGAGSGNSERLLSTGFDTILWSPLPKAAFEYGIVAGGLLILFVLLCMLDRAPWRVVPGALVILTIVLEGGLLLPQTAYLAWLLSGLGAREEPGTAGAFAVVPLPRKLLERSWRLSVRRRNPTAGATAGP